MRCGSSGWTRTSNPPVNSGCGFAPSLSTRNLVIACRYGIVSADLVRQATAESTALARFCPFNSMAPVPAIADLVADRLFVEADRDPVGETSTPIATGPPLVSCRQGGRHGYQTYVRVES
jgi:hypothetical protein